MKSDRDPTANTTVDESLSRRIKFHTRVAWFFVVLALVGVVFSSAWSLMLLLVGIGEVIRVKRLRAGKPTPSFRLWR